MLKIKAKSYLIIYIAKRLVYFRSDFDTYVFFRHRYICDYLKKMSIKLKKVTDEGKNRNEI